MAEEITLHGNFTGQTGKLIAESDIEAVDRAQFILHNMGIEDSNHFAEHKPEITSWAVASLHSPEWGLLIVMRSEDGVHSFEPEWFMLYVQVGEDGKDVWKKYRSSNSLGEIAQIVMTLMTEGAKDKHGKNIDDMTVNMVKWHLQWYTYP